MIGTDGGRERESGKSVLAVRHDECYSIMIMTHEKFKLGLIAYQLSCII